MATAYLADTWTDIQISAPWGVAQGWARAFEFNIAHTTGAAGFVINDTVALCPIPYKQGVIVMGYHVEVPNLDSGGTAVRISLGDTNGSAGAFQATFASGLQVGAGNAGVLHPLMCFDATTARAPVRGVIPKQYSISTLYTGYTAWPTISFMLKITTAATTTTTSGIIKGVLRLQTLNTSSVTF